MPTDNENIRIDKVNDNISLIQRKSGLTFGTDALLLASFINSKSCICAELGSGTGIISLLMLTRNKASKIYAYEIQKEYAKLTLENAELNGLKDRISVIEKDVRAATATDTDGEVDVVFTNPPYMRKGSGINNFSDEKNIARREVFGDIEDFCKAAAKLLKYGGKFYCVYRPQRLGELIHSMTESKIEPKRLTLIYPDSDSEPSLVLMEGKYGGGKNLTITRPLVIYNSPEHKEYTDDLKYIYDNGVFPKERF